MNLYIKYLKKLNLKAKSNNDVPVSTLILKDNHVIAKGYNRREKENNPLLHSEVIAIQKAAKKLGTWNLSDCKLIVTLKPCTMCMEVIKAARIKEVYYILDNEKNINNNVKLTKLNCEDYNYFKNELKNFFINKR